MRRANAILLLDKGWLRRGRRALFLDDSTVRAWLKEFQEGGVEAIVLFDLKGGIGRLWPTPDRRIARLGDGGAADDDHRDRAVHPGAVRVRLRPALDRSS